MTYIDYLYFLLPYISYLHMNIHFRQGGTNVISSTPHHLSIQACMELFDQTDSVVISYIEECILINLLQPKVMQVVLQMI